MSKQIIKVKNLTKYYGKKLAVDDISFTVNEGIVLGLIGPNAAGKSTTLKALIHLINIDKGTIKLFDRLINKEFEDIMQFVGYCASENSLYENMTGIQLIKYANSFYENDHMEYALQLAKRLNVDLNDKIKDLSLGSKRKINIIISLFHKPKIVLLDEPSNALDPVSKNELYKIIKEFKAMNSTIIYSSHDLNEIHYLCDELLIIKNGKLVPNVNIKDLKKSFKRIKFETLEVMEKKLLNIKGIKELVIEDNKVSFLFNG
ncbi:MAG: ABC transporter ATP-binding protein, partial [Anaeroplasmataceae bacterium]